MEIVAPTVIDLSTTPEQRLALLWTTMQAATTSPAVLATAERLRRESRLLAASKGLDPERTYVVSAMAFVQGLPVIPDPPGLEVFQPVELTLIRGGDCDDHTGALGTLLELGGVRVRLEWFTLEPAWPLNHITLMALVNGDWLWAESSVRGARLGEDPLDAAERLSDWKAFDGG